MEIIKPKPGSYRGVEYRSQLEIAWARWLFKSRPTLGRWKYTDASDHDFHLKSSSVDLYVEVKPPVNELIELALLRLDMGRLFDLMEPPTEFQRQRRWHLFIGQPPSPYEFSKFVCAHFKYESHIEGPFISKVADITSGIVEYRPSKDCGHFLPSLRHVMCDECGRHVLAGQVTEGQIFEPDWEERWRVEIDYILQNLERLNSSLLT
jgi:hypothetical protein